VRTDAATRLNASDGWRSGANGMLTSTMSDRRGCPRAGEDASQVAETVVPATAA
jgi:hypothetical protein